MPLPFRARHDLGYRQLFSHPRMVEDLVRGFVPEAWTKQLDFSTLERQSASFVSEGLDSREGDCAWRLRFLDAPVHVYVLLEFQSEVDRFMALRQSVYLGLFYQQLLNHGALTPDGLLPPVLSVVIYNGKADWSAARELGELVFEPCGPGDAHIPRLRFRLIEMESYRPEELRGSNLVALLIRLERSTTRASLRRVIRDLVKAVTGPDESRLRRAFVVWLQRVLLPSRGEEDIPELVDLKEFRTMLIDRVEEWSRQIEARSEKKGRREGLKQGRAEGMERGLEAGRREVLLRQIEVKFGPLDTRTKSRIDTAEPRALLKWAERVVTAEKLADVFAG